MLCNNASVHIEKLTDCFLRQPYIMILHTDLDALFARILRKHKKIHCAVSNLQLTIPGHDVSPSFIR